MNSDSVKKLLAAVHEQLSEKILDDLKSYKDKKEVPPASWMKEVRELLKDNDIQVRPSKGGTLRSIADELPFVEQRPGEKPPTSQLG